MPVSVIVQMVRLDPLASVGYTEHSMILSLRLLCFLLGRLTWRALHASQRSSDGETAAVDEADRLVPNRVVRRDLRWRRAQDALLRPRNGGLAGAVGTADGDGRLLRTSGRPPGFRRSRRGRGHRVRLSRLAMEPRGSQRLHPLREATQPRPQDAYLPRGGTQRVGLHLA